MNTKKVLDAALNGLDYVGFQLDQYGITGKVNRHNLAALLMAEQHHLEGQWDSLQARIDRRRAGLEALLGAVETRAEGLLVPLRRLRKPA